VACGPLRSVVSQRPGALRRAYWRPDLQASHAAPKLGRNIRPVTRNRWWAALDRTGRLKLLSASSEQLRSLQMLRAVASTSVVYFHTLRNPHFGSFGVELFFVVSGLVISMVAESRTNWIEFTINRITRIVPAYWILTTLWLMLVTLSPQLIYSTAADDVRYFKSIFFIPYLNQDGTLMPALQVGWTLNYEMLFYALAAISIGVAPKKSFFVVTAVLVITAWIIGHLLPSTWAESKFLSSGELIVFILGMLAWRLRDLGLLRRVPAPIAISAIVALYAAMAWWETGGIVIVRLPHSVAYGLPSFIIVLLALRLDSALAHAKHAIIALVCHIGDASYATYLSHLFVIEPLKKVMESRAPSLVPDTSLGAVVAVAGSLLVGSAIYIIVDKNSVKISRRFIKRHIYVAATAVR
jgi:exopolysaccharide production protein ExoZ